MYKIPELDRIQMPIVLSIPLCFGRGPGYRSANRWRRKLLQAWKLSKRFPGGRRHKKHVNEVRRCRRRMQRFGFDIQAPGNWPRHRQAIKKEGVCIGNPNAIARVRLEE